METHIEVKDLTMAYGSFVIQRDLTFEIDTSDINNIIEYPAVSVGRIDDVFMKLPREVLITSMREHQKDFAVVDENGDLLPYFVAVNNTEANDPALVQRGHEKVLRARLADVLRLRRAMNANAGAAESDPA